MHIRSILSAGTTDKLRASPIHKYILPPSSIVKLHFFLQIANEVGLISILMAFLFNNLASTKVIPPSEN